MNKFFPVKSAGNDVIPTTAGYYYTDVMTEEIGNSGGTCQVYIEFFSDAAGTVPVTPLTGTIDIEGSPLGNNYLKAPVGGTLNASTVITPLSTYTVPQFTGRVARGRINFAAITGAAYARIVFWKYGS